MNVKTCVAIAALLVTTPALAAKDNTFSATLGLGETYAPIDYRLSFGTFDVGFGKDLGLYGGSRVWKDSYYAGFGLGSDFSSLSYYGMVGYEWRPLGVVGMTFELDGIVASTGETDGRAIIGITVGW